LHVTHFSHFIKELINTLATMIWWIVEQHLIVV
jgi:hypothetical protein